MASERASRGAFLGVSALLFAASAAVTIVWCGSMSAMGEMPMPGGGTTYSRKRLDRVRPPPRLPELLVDELDEAGDGAPHRG